MLKNLGRITVLWFLLGSAYFLLELLWRMPFDEMPHPVMLMVGGICGIAAGGVTRKPRLRNMPVAFKALAGTATTLLFEYAFGLLFNVAMGLNIWDYTGRFGNIAGQICLPFAIAWFIIMPMAIWLNDYLCWGFGWRERKYGLLKIYKDFILLK